MRQTFWDDPIDTALDFHWNREAIQEFVAGGGRPGNGHAGLPALGIPHAPFETDATPSVHELQSEFHGLRTTSELDGDRPPPTIAGSQQPFAAFQSGPIFAAGPNEAAETSFLNGIDVSGIIVATSFNAWNGDTPATYSTNTTTAKWGSGTAGTTGGTVDYFFKNTWGADEKDVVRSALALWSSVCNITFNELATATGAELTFKHNSSGSAFEQDTSLSGPAGAGQVGSATLLTRNTATVSIDTSVPGFGPMDGSFTAFGGYVWGTIIHEIGHALGLGHGGAYNGNVNSATQQFSAYDSNAWTIMSYIEPGDSGAKFYSSYPIHTHWGTSADGYTNTPTTMMLLDILAVQQLYGTPGSTPLSGGQVFGFNTNLTGLLQKFYDFTINTNPIVTIWDAGTGNTLDLSGFSAKSTVDLNPGAFSSCNGLTNNICIALNTAIDAFVGGSGADTVKANADADLLLGGSGNDAFVFKSVFTGADSVDGGVGNDVLKLSGKTTATFGATTLVNVETITVSGGTAKLTTDDATVGAGKTLTVNGAAANKLTFSGSAETDGKFVVTGGAGADVLTGGAKDDTLNGGAGDDILKGGKGADTLIVDSGNDTLVYSVASQSSTGPAYDTIKSFDFAAGDHFDLDVAVAAIDATVASGALSQASFNTDLVAAIGSGQLLAHDAVLFTPTSGDLAGSTFLIVDANGTAGYQANSDYVFKLDTALNTASLDTSDFI